MPIVLPNAHGGRECVGVRAKQEALSNDLVFYHIAQYLTHNELKKALLTCKRFLQKIRLYKYFQNSSIVRLHGLDFSNKYFNISNNQILIWKFIEINIDVPLNNFKCYPDGFSAKKRFEHAEFLSIFLLQTVLELKCQVLQIILTSSHALKALTLQYGLLAHGVIQETLDNQFVEFILRNLEELYISCGRNSLDFQLLQGYSEETLESNVRKLGSISTHLKRLKWSPDGGNLTGLLQSNARTLNSLYIHLVDFPGYSNIESIKEISFPKLRELKISGFSFTSENINFYLTRFLEKQQPLLDLELHFQDVSAELLRAVSKAHGVSLKHLRISSYDSSGNSSWLHHLSRMQQLKQVYIGMCWSPSIDYYSVPSALKALPKAVSQLTIHGFYYGKWNRICEHICSKCPDYCSCESKCECLQVPPAEANIAQLRQFVNLTKLTVASQIGEDNQPEYACMMDDPMLQLIIQNLPKLKSLRFGHCERLTDFGLTGSLPDGRRTGVGISGLNDLRELGIVDCPLVTNPALLAAIVFPRLASLSLITRDWAPSSSNVAMVRRIVEQNPCLTSIRIHLHVENLESSLKAANPSLANVINAHSEDCGCPWGFNETTLYRPFFGNWE